MNKKQFMNKLRSLIPPSESNEILLDFEEHFATGLADGKTEEEIVKALGSPTEIAREYGYTEEKQAWASTVSPSTRIMAGIGLVLFDLLVGFAIIGSLIGVWCGIWGTVIGLLGASIGLMFGGFFIDAGWFLGITSGLACLGLTILSAIGMCYVSKYFWKGLVWYWNVHVKVFTGK